MAGKWKVAYDPKKTIPELQYRVAVLARGTRQKRPVIKSADDLNQLMQGNSSLDREAFYVAMLRKNGELIGIYVAHIGGTSTTLVEPAVVLRVALICQADRVIAMHNHPSGFEDPSPEDITLTQKLQAALDAFDIKLSDHLVLAKGDYFSFEQARLL